MLIDGYATVPLIFLPGLRAYDMRLAIIERCIIRLITGTDFCTIMAVPFVMEYMSGPRFRPTPEAGWVM